MEIWVVLSEVRGVGWWLVNVAPSLSFPSAKLGLGGAPRLAPSAFNSFSLTLQTPPVSRVRPRFNRFLLIRRTGVECLWRGPAPEGGASGSNPPTYRGSSLLDLRPALPFRSLSPPMSREGLFTGSLSFWEEEFLIFFLRLRLENQKPRPIGIVLWKRRQTNIAMATFLLRFSKTLNICISKWTAA